MSNMSNTAYNNQHSQSVSQGHQQQGYQQQGYQQQGLQQGAGTVTSTDVCEEVLPAVTHETVLTTERHETTVNLDREIHIDHYQQRIQPIVDKQVIAEQHVHNVVPVEQRKIHAEMPAEATRALQAQQSAFQDERNVLATQRTTVDLGTTATERVHHHIKETIQPVIEREVIQPKVIHTTIPIHEHVVEAPIVHKPTVQPVMTMAEFQKAGGALGGRGEVCEVFPGEAPRVAPNGGAGTKLPSLTGGVSGGQYSGSTGQYSTSGTTSGQYSTGMSGTTGGQYTTTGVHTNDKDTMAQNVKDAFKPGHQEHHQTTGGQYSTGTTGGQYSTGTTGGQYSTGMSGTTGGQYTTTGVHTNDKDTLAQNAKDALKPGHQEHHNAGDSNVASATHGTESMSLTDRIKSVIPGL